MAATLFRPVPSDIIIWATRRLLSPRAVVGLQSVSPGMFVSCLYCCHAQWRALSSPTGRRPSPPQSPPPAADGRRRCYGRRAGSTSAVPGGRRQSGLELTRTSGQRMTAVRLRLRLYLRLCLRLRLRFRLRLRSRPRCARCPRPRRSCPRPAAWPCPCRFPVPVPVRRDDRERERERERAHRDWRLGEALAKTAAAGLLVANWGLLRLTGGRHQLFSRDNAVCIWDYVQSHAMRAICCNPNNSDVHVKFKFNGTHIGYFLWYFGIHLQ